MWNRPTMRKVCKISPATVHWNQVVRDSVRYSNLCKIQPFFKRLLPFLSSVTNFGYSLEYVPLFEISKKHHIWTDNVNQNSITHGKLNNRRQICIETKRQSLVHGSLWSLSTRISKLYFIFYWCLRRVRRPLRQNYINALYVAWFKN